jgi:hypothetical protein
MEAKKLQRQISLGNLNNEEKPLEIDEIRLRRLLKTLKLIVYDDMEDLKNSAKINIEYCEDYEDSIKNISMSTAESF